MRCLFYSLPVCIYSTKDMERSASFPSMQLFGFDLAGKGLVGCLDLSFTAEGRDGWSRLSEPRRLAKPIISGPSPLAVTNHKSIR